MPAMDRITSNRAFLKSTFPDLDEIRTDQQRNLPPPPLQKPCVDEAPRVALGAPDPSVVVHPDLHAVIARRRSRRWWTPAPLPLAELSYLLWATQGVERVFGRSYSTFRTVPSAGARHPLETYLAVNRVPGLEPGLYRYLPLSHELAAVRVPADLASALLAAGRGQSFVASAALVFIWTAVPYRAEWAYAFAAHKMILVDAGHVCQNLYLACEATGSGTCAVAAYDQPAADTLVGADGIDETVVYMAPVGKIKG